MRWYVFLLYPFALLYDLVTKVRNWFFDLGWLKSGSSPIPSIVVGNLSVGGTGKTPMVEYLIRMLQKQVEVATLSRGYGRKTKGFIEANQQITPQQIGDEPFQVYQKFGRDVAVFVGEDRVNALIEIASKTVVPKLVILDDAYQHRYLKGDLTILLTTYQAPFFSDFLLPMGRLRESRVGAKRAHVIIVTKCPSDLTVKEKQGWRQKISVFKRPEAPVLFSSISYGQPVPLHDFAVFSSKIILLTGLANDQPLIEFVKENYVLVETLSYPDHHDYTLADFSRIQSLVKQLASENPVVLTTEKDAVKVKSNAPTGFLKEIPIFVLPIEVSFSADDELTLAKLILQKVLNKDNS